jgi:hypothetical protein
LNPDLVRAGVKASAVKGEVFSEVMEKLVTPLLCLEHESEGRVPGKVDGLEGVHLNGNAKAHGREALADKDPAAQPVAEPVCPPHRRSVRPAPAIQ